MSPVANAPIVRTYVWQIPVRVSHWLIVLSILVLSATGLYIGHPFLTVPGEARNSFVMGWIRTIHLYTAVVFASAVLMRVIWMFTGNRYARWDKFLPVHRSRRHGLWPTIKFYLFGLRKPPGFVGHNPVAGVTYLAVFALYFVAIGTGLTMYAPYADVGSPWRWFAALAPLVGGFQMAHWIHHVVMWLLLGFMLHHIYSGTLMSIIEANGTMESIFSGYKFVPPEDLEFSGYRFINRKGQVDE
jgi:Ni/Fe-hydrogenase 1 B-type cytochrome subunit